MVLLVIVWMAFMMMVSILHVLNVIHLAIHVKEEVQIIVLPVF